MTKQIRILFIEDSKNDCELIVNHFGENGYQVTHQRAETAHDMELALSGDEFDIVLCDHSLPNFDIFSALALAKTKIAHVPFIVVSGTVSEEVAVDSVKSGAKDYVLKNNLARLIPAVERELREAKMHVLLLQTDLELKQKDSELRQAQKLEAIGQLAGGVAHDFNNILAIILLHAESSLEHLNANPELKKTESTLYNSFEQIRKSGLRAANLTRQLMAFSRKQVVQPVVLNMNETIHDLEKMLGCVIEENIHLHLDLGKDCKNIKADLGHFEQIILNLVVNSRDAMPKGGKITIKTERIVLSDEAAKRLNAITGAYAVLEIADTGAGMSEEIKKHIFEPFFTTKAVGKGTGLGLSTVYGIVKQNNGFISVESAPNEGATFKIYFPEITAPLTLNVPAGKSTQPRRSETILVVEDETALRELTCRILRDHGYEILEAQDGSKALEYLRSHETPIHLVLTDVIMPKMGGPELSEKAKGLQRKSKFLFSSGYTEDVLLLQGVSSGQSHFLEKPYSMQVLLTKVREILEEGQECK